MNKIKINEKYMITNDERQWIIQRKSGKRWENYHYFSTIVQVITDLFELLLLDGDCKTLGEIKELALNSKVLLSKQILGE